MLPHCGNPRRPVGRWIRLTEETHIVEEAINKRNGILLIDGATARIQDNVISSNNTDGQGFGGIGVIRGALADLGGGNTISQNTGDGIGIIQGVLSVRLGFPSTTQNVIEYNSDEGIFASNGSSVRMSSGTINNNDDIGIFVLGGSSLEIRGGTVQKNGSRGILVFNGSSLEIRGGTIQQNVGDGIFSTGSSVEIRGGAIQQNGGRGIDLGDNSTLRIRNSSVQNNIGNGIRVGSDSSVKFRGPAATVSGNGVFDLTCLDSESSFAGDTTFVAVIDPGCTGF